MVVGDAVVEKLVVEVHVHKRGSTSPLDGEVYSYMALL